MAAQNMGVYRYHTKRCGHTKRSQMDCKCPLHLHTYVDGKLIQVSLKTNNWARAEKRAQAIIDGEAGVTKPLKAAIESWQLDLNSRKIAASTQRGYKRLMRQLQEWCGTVEVRNLDALTVERLLEFRAWRDDSQENEEGLAATTAQKEHGILVTFLQFAKDNGWIHRNPMDSVKPPTVRDNEIVPYTLPEIEAIKFAAGRMGFHDYERNRALAAILVMRWTGMRISDACSLRRSQVVNGVINIFCKKNRTYVGIPVPTEVIEALANVHTPIGSPAGNDFYFWNQQVPRGIIQTGMCRALRQVYILSGVKDAKNHRFRHTFISEGLAAGNTERKMSDMIGISEGTLRKHYSRWMVARQHEVNAAVALHHDFIKRQQELANTGFTLNAPSGKPN